MVDEKAVIRKITEFEPHKVENSLTVYFSITFVKVRDNMSISFAYNLI
jgi:hypothetical protein